MSDAGTSSSRARLRGDVLRVIFGPWPIQPITLGIILAVMTQYAASSTAADPQQNMRSVLELLPLSVARAFIIIVPMWLMLKVRQRFVGQAPLTRRSYLIIVIATAVYAGTIRYGTTASFDDFDWRLYLFYVTRAIVILMILQTVLGLADARLRSAKAMAEQARTQVEQQRSLVLDAEERARAQVASFLHDTVQSGLVAVSMQIQRVADKAPPDVATQLSSIVTELEEIRGVDVRSASRRLSPQLSSATLPSAVRELALGYAPAMQVDVMLEPAQEALPRLRGEAGAAGIGMYRIIEQSLLNAAVHGRAQHVVVRARVNESGLSLAIVDDGEGFEPSGAVRGAGFAIIDAWVGVLEGSWRIVSGRRDGTTVIVDLPFT